MNLETSNLVHWLIIASPSLSMKNLPWKGRGQGQVTHFRIFSPHVISPQRLMLETSNFVCELTMRSLSLVLSECSLSGCGQGHVSNFYIVNLKILPQQVISIQVIYTTRPSSVCLWHLRQWEPTRSRHGWVHIVYHALPPTKSPTSYHRFGQDLSYK